MADESRQIPNTRLWRPSSCAAHRAHGYSLDKRRGKAISKAGWSRGIFWQASPFLSWNYHGLYETAYLTVWVLLCFENCCCVAVICMSARVGYLQVLALTSATYMMSLGCSCALMVAQQHHHSHTELPKTSRTQHTQGLLLCLESAEGSDGPWSCGLWLKVFKRQQGVWSAFQCLWHYEGCKTEQNLFILLHLVTSEPVLRQVNWAAA